MHVASGASTASCYTEEPGSQVADLTREPTSRDPCIKNRSWSALAHCGSLPPLRLPPLVARCHSRAGHCRLVSVIVGRTFRLVTHLRVVDPDRQGGDNVTHAEVVPCPAR